MASEIPPPGSFGLFIIQPLIPTIFSSGFLHLLKTPVATVILRIIGHISRGMSQGLEITTAEQYIEAYKLRPHRTSSSLATLASGKKHTREHRSTTNGTSNFPRGARADRRSGEGAEL
ncbi:hypothetical protein DFH06DRAFT_1151942 [Mycena polygramma]|nr:hypothetical protein DFH06DRAFT_1151942 [Mycena polygramma]